MQLFSNHSHCEWCTTVYGQETHPYAYNHRDAMMHWFVDREDGFATSADMLPVRGAPLILQHVPDKYRPAWSPVTRPYMPRHERCAAKIQRAWRNCIADPEYQMCVTRLQREFQSLADG